MSCRFLTCLQLWQGKEVGYNCNSPTCAWCWIWPKWPKNAIRGLQLRKRNNTLRNTVPRSEKRKSVVCFLAIQRWRLGYKDTRQYFVITKRPAAFLGKMASQRIRRHAGDTKDQVNLPPPNTECGLPSRLHLRPACHPLQLVTLAGLNCLKSSIYRPDIGICVQLFRVRNFSMILRIPSLILILIQIWWMMMVSTLSVVW